MVSSPLRKWREARKLTQQELGTSAGVTRTIVGWVEDGQKALTGALREKLSSIDPALVIAQDQYFEHRRQEIEEKVTGVCEDA